MSWESQELTLSVHEVSGDRDVIHMFQWSSIQLHVAMYAGVVKEIKRIVLNNIARRVTAHQIDQSLVTTLGDFIFCLNLSF